jgi:hypothetical protein
MTRVLASLLLALLAAGLVVVGIAGIVAAATGHQSAGAGGGIAFVFLLALLSGSAARVVARGRPPASAAPSVAAPSVAAPPGPASSVPVTGVAAGLPGTGLPGAGPGSPGRGPAVRPGVRYRERCSQFPVTGAVVAVILLAAGLAGLVVDGGPNGRGAGAGGALALGAALGGAGYLLLVLLDLPNGIEVGDGLFAAGVSGVRPAGRIWRRVAGPLDAITGWQVLSAAQARELGAARRAAAPRGRPRKYLGDLRMLGRRQVLMLRVDPAAVQVSFPARILAGYVLVPTAVTGAVWDGVVLIGTRRPARLAGALAQALPGRCLTRDAT